jgi:DNA-binding GntR family transcriptional regulator
LKVLEVQGFVTHRPFSKPVVAAVSPHRIEEVFLMRIALEGAAVARSALIIDEPELKYLERCSEHCRKALLKQDAAAWSRHNREFHTRLAAAAGMPLLSREIDSLIDLSSFFSSISWKDIPDAFADAQLEHLGIVQACRDRKPELAQKLMQEHLAASCAVQVDLARERERDVQEVPEATGAGAGKGHGRAAPHIAVER